MRPSKSHPFDIDLVHKLRLRSRDSLESFTSKAILKRHRVRLISVQEPVVGSDAPEDAFMEHILVGMAEFYSKNLGSRNKKGPHPKGYRRRLSRFSAHRMDTAVRSLKKKEGQKRMRTINPSGRK